MLIHLGLLADDHLDAPARTFAELATTSRCSDHGLTDSAEEADVVLFTQCHLLNELRLERIKEHPLTQRYQSKVMVYDERDRPWCSFPGIYVSMPAPQFKWAAQRAGGYYVTPDGGQAGSVNSPDLLFSFMASASHRCRQSLFELAHPRAVVEEARQFVFYDSSSLNFTERRDKFRDVVARSSFVLCPRGQGTSSIRLYETMAAGRAPVIIADDWVPPAGPEWDRFSIRWPENVTDGLPEFLESREADAKTMGLAARAAWEEHFGPEVAFQRIADGCEALHRSGAGVHFPAGGVRDAAYLRLGAEQTGRRLRSRAGAAARRLRRG